MEKFGECHLCGKEGKLTFEHVPPKKANNNERARLLTGREIFNIDKIKKGKSLRYINQQQGAGWYSLCAECNNNTGDWYASEYIKFANNIGYILTNEIKSSDIKGIEINSNKLYFQRIIKQILCMFLSTTQPNKLNEIEDIRRFILDKNNKDFNDKKYRIGMYLLKKYEISHSGIIQMLVEENGKLIIRKIAIMNLYPLGFILEIEPFREKELEEIVDITNLTKLEYDEMIEVRIPLYITDRYLLSNITKDMVNKYKNK